MTSPLTSLRIGALAWRMVAAGVAAVAVGFYPTWRLAGSAGLFSMVAAGLAAAIGYAAALAILLPRVRQGARTVGLGFLATGPIRLVATLGLTALAWAVWHWPVAALFIWAVAFYLVFLAAEVTWLMGLLRTVQ